MKDSSFHSCPCAFLWILFLALLHSTVEGTLGVTALPEGENLEFTFDDQVQKEATPTPLALSKPTPSVALPNDDPSDHGDYALERMSEGKSDRMQLQQTDSKTAAVTPQRKLKKDGGKTSKKGQNSPDIESTNSGFFDDLDVARQSIPVPSPMPRLNPVPSPVIVSSNSNNNDNVFDRRRSPEYIYTRPSFRPPLLPLANPASPSTTGTRPTLPTRGVPTRAPRPTPTINTPMPTSEATESFFPTDSATIGGTLEFTTLPPSFSPAPTK